MHGNCQAEGGGSQLGTAVDRGLSKAKGTGGGRELPLPLVPMARAPTQLGTGQRHKGHLGAAQHWAKGAPAGTADTKAGTQ